MKHAFSVTLYIVLMLLRQSFFIFQMKENFRDSVLQIIVQINNQIINNTSQLFEINE